MLFNWIKQQLRINLFFGTSENAVKTQVWIAVARVRFGRHRSQAPQSGAILARNVTDPQRYAIRENTVVSAPYSVNDPRKHQCRSQPTDFTLKRVGHY
jgi:hypothetical protein